MFFVEFTSLYPPRPACQDFTHFEFISNNLYALKAIKKETIMAKCWPLLYGLQGKKIAANYSQ